MSKFFRLTAIVLKRNNFSDTDRFITVFSRERGKIDLLAKGVRKLHSKKRSSLEIGNLVKLHCVQGKKTPLITQAELITTFSSSKSSLTQITQAYQILEIVDSLTVETVEHPQVFHQLHRLLSRIQTPGNHRIAIINTIKSILTDLGFGLPETDSETNLKNHLESIIDRPLRSKLFLTV